MRAFSVAALAAGAFILASPAFAQTVIPGQTPGWYQDEIQQREDARRSGRRVDPLPEPPQTELGRRYNHETLPERRGPRRALQESSKPAARFNVWMRSLNRRNESCLTVESTSSIVCTSAASRWCSEDGYVGGMITEIDGEKGLATVVCY